MRESRVGPACDPFPRQAALGAVRCELGGVCPSFQRCPGSQPLPGAGPAGWAAAEVTACSRLTALSVPSTSPTPQRGTGRETEARGVCN